MLALRDLPESPFTYNDVAPWLLILSGLLWIAATWVTVLRHRSCWHVAIHTILCLAVLAFGSSVADDGEASAWAAWVTAAGSLVFLLVQRRPKKP